MEETEVFPFIFINHGKPIDIYSFQGEKYFIFSFKETVNEQTVKKIEKLTPKILSGSFLWSDKMMMNYSITDEDEIIMYYMKKRRQGFDAEMDEDLMMELFTDFANDIEEWAVNVNKIASVDFFIGHPRISGSDWDKYSVNEIPNVMNKLEAESMVMTPRKKQIISEALQLIKESKESVLIKEMLKKISDMMKVTC